MNHRNDHPGEFHPGNPGFQDQESNPDQYGREHFGRKQYGPQGEPHYFGTGSQGHGGGPSFGNPRPRPQRRRYPLGPKGYQRSDERLREDISERLMEAYEIDSSEVTVQVLGGKVVLEGTVPDRYMKHAIEDLADAAPGVQDVDNRIRVATRAGSGPGPGDTGRPRDS
jgi:hypothetical protein